MKPLSRNKRGLKDGSPVVKAMRRWAIRQNQPFTVKEIQQNMTFACGKSVKDSRSFSHSEHTLYCYLKRSNNYEIVDEYDYQRRRAATFKWRGE
tara:strand:- start:2862 stop:3143 length:282 start_codon:yes stop_codon:yes gene_type:complete